MPSIQNNTTFQEIWETHHAAIYRLLYSCTKHAQDAEDLTQETFIELWKTSKPINSPKAWLFTAALRNFIDFVRHKEKTRDALESKHLKRHTIDGVKSANPDSESHLSETPGQSIEDSRNSSYSQQLEWEILIQGLQCELPEFTKKDWVILILRIKFDATDTQIARFLTYAPLLLQKGVVDICRIMTNPEFNPTILFDKEPWMEDVQLEKGQLKSSASVKYRKENIIIPALENVYSDFRHL